MNHKLLLRILLAAWSLTWFASGFEEAAAWPHRFAIKTWRVGSGLPHQRVQAVCQTGDGLLWIGTIQGLARFDGTAFTRVPLPGDPAVSRLAAGRDNELWIGAGDGSLWHGKNHDFHKVPLDDEKAFKDGFEILAVDASDRLWITTRTGAVFSLDQKELHHRSREWIPRYGLTLAHQARIGSSGQPVINSPNGIWVLDGEDLRPVPGYPGLSTLFHAPGREDSYWVSDSSGVRRLSRGVMSLPVAPALWADRGLNFGLEDHDGRLWLATQGHGILCYGPSGGISILDTRDGLCGDFASCLYEDRQGNIWVGSDGGGLSRVTPAVFSVAGRVSGLPSDRVTALLPTSNGGQWIGTYADGMGFFDGKTFQRLENFPNVFSVLSLAGDPDSPWIGGWNGLYRWHRGTLQRLAGWPHHERPVTALHQDLSGGLWIGQRTPGIVYRLRKDGKLSTVRLGDHQDDVDVRCFAEDDQGGLWIGTDGAGLFHWNREKVSPVGHFSRINALEISRRHLYIAADGLLSRLPLDAGKETSSEKILEGAIHTLLADSLDRLWIVDDLGLALLTPQSPESSSLFTRFGSADGLPGLQGAGIGFPQAVKDASGQLWFCTTAGVAMADPSHFIDQPPSPPVQISELRVSGSSRWAGPASSSPTFTSGDRGFEFRFAAIDLKHPEMLEFSTRIDGIDRDWRPPGPARTVFHASLPPGRHLFRVKARNRGGPWSRESTLAFEILPPLWQRGWFLALSGLLGLSFAAGLSWLLSNWRMQKQLSALKLERALEAERSRIARDIHDQLGAGLTEIAYLGDYLGMDAQDEIAHGASSVSSRARELTRAMDETVWALNPDNDTFDSLVTYLGHSMPGWLRHSGIRCRLDFPEEPPRFALSGRIRQQIYLACKEAVHNIVKHSHARTATLQISSDDKEIILQLHDDGNGFDPGRVPLGKGNGLANLRRRLTDLGGSASFDSSPGHGATVTFRLPLDILS